MTQSRRMLVLRAVVEDYIRSQEPVGSTTLTKDHDLGVSSATVRNDMAALEDEGYLIQPHTSAGRIPTEKGYRYFVDRLATVVPMSEAQRRGINSFSVGIRQSAGHLAARSPPSGTDHRSGRGCGGPVVGEIDITAYRNRSRINQHPVGRRHH